MAKSSEKFIVYNMRETYHELGTYEFKVVLNPRSFDNSHTSEVNIIDSDGKQMKHDVKKWGRKINCSFVLDESVSDGVAVVMLNLKNDSSTYRDRIVFWVIKP